MTQFPIPVNGHVDERKPYSTQREKNKTNKKEKNKFLYRFLSFGAAAVEDEQKEEEKKNVFFDKMP